MSANFLSLKNEVYRKLIHFASCLIPIIYIYTTKEIFLSILLFSFFANLSTNYYQNKNLKIPFLSNLFNLVLRPYERSRLWGSTYMLLGFILISIIFPKDFAIAGMLITSISDSLAAIIGMKYGKIKIIHNKTLEGFFSFIISCYIILFITINSISFTVLYLISLISGIVELATPTKYDNITIPIGVSLTLYLFSIL